MQNKAESDLEREKVKTINIGALSVWYQLNNPAEFMLAFKALSQLKRLLISTDIYGKMFSRNVYYLAYNDFE